MGRRAAPDGLLEDRARERLRPAIGVDAGGSEDVCSKAAAGEAPSLGVVGVKAWR
jgi:hypothetical protein